jgi:transposase
MSTKSNPTVAKMGIDIGKNSFHVVGLDQRGAIVLRQKWSRGQIEARLANMPPCLIGMEACVGAHHLSRKLQSLGHDARLMPAKYVRPYAKGQKNDFGETIAEAVLRPTMKFVATKTTEQLDLQALHRVREWLVSQRTGIINQIRAFLLERGVGVRQGIRFLRAELPRILATRSDVLSPRMVRIIEELAGDWHRLDQRIESLSTDIKALADQDQACERLMSVPGVGPIISSAMVAAIGNGAAFSEGARLRRLARVGTQADVDRRSHNPGQDLEAGQSLSARPVRAGRLGRAGEADDLGTPRAQALDRSRQEAPASKRPGDRACQQTRPHRMGGPQQGTQIRIHQDEYGGVPSCLSVAPCSEPPRRGLETPASEASQARRPALTALRAAPDVNRTPGRRNGLMARTKELHQIRSNR